MERGTESGAAKVVSFVSGVIPQVVDPIGFAIGSAIGFGLPKLLGQAAKNAAFSRGILAKSTLAKNVAEGVAGNLVSEFAIVNPISRQEQADVDSQQSFINAVVGGAGLPLAANALRRTFSYLSPKRAEETFGRAQQVVESQVQNGKKPNLDDFVEADRALKEGSEIPNRNQVAERFDQEEADLYFDPEDRSAFQRHSVEIESANRTQDLDNELQEVFSEVDDFEGQGRFTEKELEEIGEIRALGDTEQTDIIIKAATSCLRGTV